MAAYLVASLSLIQRGMAQFAAGVNDMVHQLKMQ